MGRVPLGRRATGASLLMGMCYRELPVSFPLPSTRICSCCFLLGRSSEGFCTPRGRGLLHLQNICTQSLGLVRHPKSCEQEVLGRSLESSLEQQVGQCRPRHILKESKPSEIPSGQGFIYQIAIVLLMAPKAGLSRSKCHLNLKIELVKKINFLSYSFMPLHASG